MMGRVVVLGGGPAGLYAALLLAHRGIAVTLLEREEIPGGLTAGTIVSGIQVDYGSHRLHPATDPDILADLRSLLGDDLQLRRRHGRIHVDGSWLAFPISPSELLTRMRPATLIRLGIGAAAAILRPSRDSTYADFVTTNLGEPLGDLIYFPYARKIWGVDPHHLSGEQARRRISANTPWRLLAKFFDHEGTGRDFYYPSNGFSQIARGLADAATRAGVEIRLGSAVTGIDRVQGGFVVRSAGEEVGAGLLLSTIPITVLARLLRPPGEVESALESLAFRAMMLVYLTVPTRQWTPYDAHYIPDSDVRFTRISEPTNYRDGHDPTDHTVLCVEIPTNVHDESWAADDHALIKEVRGGIVDLGLPDPGDHGEVHRIRNAYPIYRVGGGDAFEMVTTWLDEVPGVVSFGRQGLFAHDNTHHAMAMARDAVACVSDDVVFDPFAWLGARQRFAGHVVED